ncbi:MAG TPA: hypothetical protein VNI20_05250 [Fimbriimonadaceae bacterium]|nr:hypothetical protein [Fimbriimonadaceae bacterium]
MKLDRKTLQEEIHDLYRQDHEKLDTAAHLERARQWNLSSTLADGGVAVFPHAGVLDCGYQIAACVNAALDSGADDVIVVSVLHAFTDEMQEARVRVAEGEDPSQWPFWGIQGTGLEREEWKRDHALISWRHFFDFETKRRGIKGPRVHERYPYLAGGEPERLPGIDELARLAENAVIVSTADAFHHGIGYGDAPSEALPPEEGGLDKARKTIQEGMDILGEGDYWGYNQHCVSAKSDARDAGQVFRYLRGPMHGRILDMTYTDCADLYHSPPPTWVAGALMEWDLQK